MKRKSQAALQKCGKHGVCEISAPVDQWVVRGELRATASIKCSWKRRMSSAVARVGRALEERRKPPAALNVAALRMGPKLAGGHVLEHALTQRASGVSCSHGEYPPVLRCLSTPHISTSGGRSPDPLPVISECSQCSHAHPFRAAVIAAAI